jgi:hypothetical protein
VTLASEDGSCERCNEPTGFIKIRECLEVPTSQDGPSTVVSLDLLFISLHHHHLHFFSLYLDYEWILGFLRLQQCKCDLTLFFKVFFIYRLL